MKAVRSIRDGINNILSGLNVALFGSMVAVGTYQILVRYIFNKPSTVSEELLTFMFAWMSLLAAAYVFGKREHMRMGFLADKLGRKSERILKIITEGVILLFAVVVLVYGGIQITSLTMAQKTASLGIPMGYIYLVVPVSGGFIILYSVMNMMELISGTDGDRQKEEG